MKGVVLAAIVCSACCGCVHVSKSGAPSREPIGVFPICLGTNMVVAFVNQTESPLFLEVNHKWAEYGKRGLLEDGSILIVPTFSEDMQISIPFNGWKPVRLPPGEPALAIAPMITNGCQLCGLDLLWQVYTPIDGKESQISRSSWNDVSVEDWDWSFGFGIFSGDAFAPVPFENREIKYEPVWKNGIIVNGNMVP